METTTTYKPRLPRVDFFHAIRVAPLGDGQARRLLATNLSSGGMFVATAEPWMPGTLLALEIEAAGKAYAFGAAEVVWRREKGNLAAGERLPGLGLKFLDLKPKPRSLVEHLVKRARPMREEAPGAEAPTAAAEERAPERPGGAVCEDTSAPDRAEYAQPADQIAPDASFAQREDIDPSPGRLMTVEQMAAPQVRRRSSASALFAGAVVLAGSAAGVVGWRMVVNASPASSVESAPPVAGAVIVAGPAAQPAVEVEAPVVQPVPAPTAAPTAASRPTETQLPSGAVVALRMERGPGVLTIKPALASGSTLRRVFTLTAPPRLVMDVSGAQPKTAARLASVPGVRAIRVGARPDGTRIVIDLGARPKRVAREGDRIRVTVD